MVTRAIFKIILQVIITTTFIAMSGSSVLGKSRVELRPMITISHVYEDNIYLNETNQESDYTTTISPQINLTIGSEINSLGFSYSPTFVYYHDRSDNNTVRHKTNLNVNQQFGKFFQISLGETYIRTEQPFETDSESQIVRRTRNTYERSDGSVTLNYRFGPSKNLSLGYNHSILENEDPAIDDGLVYGPFASFSYWFSSDNGIVLNYRNSKGEFNRDDGTIAGDDVENQITGIRFIHRFNQRTTTSINYELTIREFEGTSEDYRVHNSDIGFSHAFSPRTSLSANIGYFIQDRDASRDRSGLTFSTGLNRSIERGNISVSASVGQTEEFLEAERRGFTQYRSLTSRFNYQLLKQVSSYAGISYRQNDSATGVEDETYLGNFGLQTNFYRWFSANLDYTYRMRNSNAPNDEYVDNRISINLSGSRTFRSGY